MKYILLILSLFFISSTVCYAAADKKAEEKSTGVKMSTNTKVKIETTMGDITIELDAKNALFQRKTFYPMSKKGFTMVRFFIVLFPISWFRVVE